MSVRLGGIDVPWLLRSGTIVFVTQPVPVKRPFYALQGPQ